MNTRKYKRFKSKIIEERLTLILGSENIDNLNIKTKLFNFEHAF